MKQKAEGMNDLSDEAPNITTQQKKTMARMKREERGHMHPSTCSMTRSIFLDPLFHGTKRSFQSRVTPSEAGWLT